MEWQGNPSDEAIRGLLESSKRIAVVGLSPKPDRDSHRVAAALQGRGYQIVPVHPQAAEILGETVYRRVQDIPEAVDLVNVFRRGEALPEVVEDALAAGAKALWFQLGCINEQAAVTAQEAGAMVIMDRCLMVEQSRLMR